MTRLDSSASDRCRAILRRCRRQSESRRASSSMDCVGRGRRAQFDADRSVVWLRRKCGDERPCCDDPFVGKRGEAAGRKGPANARCRRSISSSARRHDRHSPFERLAKNYCDRKSTEFCSPGQLSKTMFYAVARWGRMSCLWSRCAHGCIGCTLKRRLEQRMDDAAILEQDVRDAGRFDSSDGVLPCRIS